MTSPVGSILVLGDVNVDVLLPLESYPEQGEDRRSERMVLAAGGSAANSAIELAKLGSKPQLVACVGEDPWAEVAVTALRLAGVDLTALQRSSQAGTGMMFIPVTPDGQRTLMGRRGANRLLNEPAMLQTLLTSCQALHLSGYAFEEAPQAEAARAVLRAAVEAGHFISLDTAYRPAIHSRQALAEIVPFTSLLILGEQEARALAQRETTDEAVAELLAQGAGRVAIKRGRRGASLFGPSGRCDWPALQVPTVDTTGAGDAFSAGLLFGLLAGLDDHAASLLAVACGALATTVWGAGAGLPERVQVRDLIQAVGSHEQAFSAASQAILDRLYL